MIRRTLVSLAFAALALPAAAGAQPRVLANLDGTLTKPAAGAPEDVALRYVRAHRAALGLDAADLDALAPPAVTTGGDITQVRWRQTVDGIPAADSELRVNLASDGRVLNVLGDPAHDLDANTTPLVDAGEAVRAVQGAVGAFRVVPRDKGPAGVTRATTYADGTTAELALDDRRLVWRVTYRASSTEVYDAFVDARSARVRRSVNLVKSVTNASVWENYPGAATGGTAMTQNLEQNGWLAAGASSLSGRNVHAYSDINDNDVADASEEVDPPVMSGLMTYTPTGGGCSADKPCTWSHTMANSWNVNRGRNAVQAFYFANKFHDHLAAAPINFTDRSFDVGDPLELQTDDGANGTGGLPDMDHRNNANMFTPPDGSRPVMQMYLWRPPNYRTMNGGDDASIVYHEYTHGLSNRLVTDAAGRGALNSPQAGAMGEGWSDWYAKDFLVTQSPALDNTGVAGDVDMGAYTDNAAHSIRTQGLDCPVVNPPATAPAGCPGEGAVGSGGYTYGDFGKIAGEPEVHADGEIWAETLWDLRTAVGSPTALRLVTQAMRLSPPEPSFLDMRNAILLADQNAGGISRTAIWTVFAHRGMGYFASTNASNSQPLEDLSPPPTPATPRGRIAGVVRELLRDGNGEAVAGPPVANAIAAIGGLESGPDRLAGTSGGDGAFGVESVPARTYPSLVVTADGYDTDVSAVTVAAGATSPANPLLARNWATVRGGATVAPGPGSAEYADQGCGPEAAVDQAQGTGWSTGVAPEGKSMVVTLPKPVNVTGITIDPAEACGDDADSATRDYRVETSTDTADGPWTAAASGAFDGTARHKLNELLPKVAFIGGVRHVRLSLLSNQGGGDFLDASEFVVHGAAVPVQTPVPVTPEPPPPAPVPTPTPLAPPSFSLPASGKTTVKFKVTCAANCRVTAKLTVDRPTAKRLGLGKVLTAGSLTATVKAGKKTLTLKLKSKARRALLKGSKKARYRARLKVTGAYAATAPVSRSRQLTLKR